LIYTVSDLLKHIFNQHFQPTFSTNIFSLFHPLQPKQKMEEQEQNMISQTIELKDYLKTNLELFEIEKEDIPEHHMRSFHRPRRTDIGIHKHIKISELAEHTTRDLVGTKYTYYYFILDGMKFYFRNTILRNSINYLEAIHCVLSTYSGTSSEDFLSKSIIDIVKFEDAGVISKLVKDLYKYSEEFEVNRERMNVIAHNIRNHRLYLERMKREREQEKRQAETRRLFATYTDRIWEHMPQTTGKCPICMSEDIECAQLECSEIHIMCKDCMIAMFINEEGIRIRCPICRKNLDYRTIGNINGIRVPLTRQRMRRRRFEQEQEEEEEEEEWEEEEEEEAI